MILYSIIFAIFTLALVSISIVTLGKPSSYSLHWIFILSFVFFIMLPIPDLIANFSVSFDYLITTFVTLIAYIFSASLFSMLFNNRSGKIAFRKNVGSEFIPRRKSIIVINIFISLAIAIYIFDVGVSGVALFALFSMGGEADFLMELRGDSLTSSISPLLTSFYGYLRALIFPVLGLLMLVSFFYKKISIFNFIYGVALVSFYMLASTAKAPFAYFLFGLVLCYYFLSLINAGGNQIKNIIKVASLTLIILIASSFIYPLLQGYTGTDGLVYALDSLYRRILFVPAHVSYIYYEAFGSSLEHTHGNGLKLIAMIKGEQWIDLPSVAYSYYFGDKFVFGRLNASFMATYWAEFGYIGVVCGSLWAGLVVSTVVYIINSLRYSTSQIICIVVCSLALIQSMFTGLENVFFGRGLISIPVLFYILEKVSFSLKGTCR